MSEFLKSLEFKKDPKVLIAAVVVAGLVAYAYVSQKISLEMALTLLGGSLFAPALVGVSKEKAAKAKLETRKREEEEKDTDPPPPGDLAT